MNAPEDDGGVDLQKDRELLFRALDTIDEVQAEHPGSQQWCEVCASLRALVGLLWEKIEIVNASQRPHVS